MFLQSFICLLDLKRGKGAGHTEIDLDCGFVILLHFVLVSGVDK